MPLPKYHKPAFDRPQASALWASPLPAPNFQTPSEVKSYIRPWQWAGLICHSCQYYAISNYTKTTSANIREISLSNVHSAETIYNTAALSVENLTFPATSVSYLTALTTMRMCKFFIPYPKYVVPGQDFTVQVRAHSGANARQRNAIRPLRVSV